MRSGKRYEVTKMSANSTVFCLLVYEFGIISKYNSTPIVGTIIGCNTTEIVL